MDSGVYAHVTLNLNTLTSYAPYDGSDKLRVDDGKGLDIFHIGITFLSTDAISLAY
jgi:hypothetical protein